MVEIPTDRSQPFGNAARNSVRANLFRQFDLGLHKAFDLGRDQTRIEAFNLFNTTNFGPANGNRSSSAFGTITSAYPARQIQLGLKFYFCGMCVSERPGSDPGGLGDRGLTP
jgi:hypothetical protein